MALSHALPADPFAAPRLQQGRRPLSFAPPRDVAGPQHSGVAPTRAGSRRERHLMLVLVMLVHLAGLAGIARLARPPAPVAEAPISVALIELPVPIPPVAAPPPPAAPEPRPVVKPHPRPKVRTPSAPPRPTPVVPAPTVESASAITADSVPPPAPETPREIPASAPATPPPPAPAAPEAPAPVVAARFDAAYLNNPAPAYPPLSRRMREEGKVMLRVQVNGEGLPGKVELAESSGFGRLDNAARESVLRWRFVPAKQHGRAIDAWVIVPIVFKLEGN
jgi:protein TonB